HELPGILVQDDKMGPGTGQRSPRPLVEIANVAGGQRGCGGQDAQRRHHAAQLPVDSLRDGTGGSLGQGFDHLALRGIIALQENRRDGQRRHDGGEDQEKEEESYRLRSREPSTKPLPEAYLGVRAFCTCIHVACQNPCRPTSSDQCGARASVASQLPCGRGWIPHAPKTRFGLNVPASTAPMATSRPRALAQASGASTGASRPRTITGLPSLTRLAASSERTISGRPSRAAAVLRR